MEWDILEGWRSLANDPETAAAMWFRDGAPQGISVQAETCGIFPEVDHTAEEETEREKCVDSLEELDEHTDLTQVASLEEDDAAWEEVQRMISKGWLKACDTLQEAESFAGAKIHPSKLVVVVKVSGGKEKRRLTLDSKRSGLRPATKKPERAVLPRITDVVEDSLDMLEGAMPGELEYLVLDFSDAFFSVPLHPRERKHFVILARGKFLVYCVTPQGGGMAPLTWARSAALVMRLTQGMFSSWEARLHCFVDDPIAVMRGTSAARDWIVATIVLTWRMLGFPLSFKKGQRGPAVNWVGATLQFTSTSVVAGIKPSIVQDLYDQTLKLLKSNVGSEKDVRSFAGRANHVAALIWAMRPFLQHAWAALTAGSKGAPPGCVWIKQFGQALHWVAAFLTGKIGPLTCTFDVETYRGRGMQVAMALDASPWGLGAILFEQGVPTQWFACEVTEADANLLSFERGSCKGQQVLESLTALVALRHWHQRWSATRVKVQVRGDSVAMLTLLLKMRPPSASLGLGVIAREMALDVANSCYAPNVLTHVPGIVNVGPDTLSRRYDPSKVEWSLPDWLKHVPETRVPTRDEGYYRSLVPPQERQVANEGNKKRRKH